MLHTMLVAWADESVHLFDCNRFFGWQLICIYCARKEDAQMLYYALVFFLIALVAAIMGFGGVAIAFAGIAKILFFLFLVLFLVSLVMHVGRRV
jgi:uncharacterized membrane protein YtjA (UPF0391 family)